MNQSQIHPALRQNSLSSPPKAKSIQYPDGAPSSYSPIQPSPTNSYQPVQTPAHYPSSQHVQDSPEARSPGGNPSDPNDLKRPRACEACRQLKVKCEPDDNSPTGSCKRCAKAHRQCIITVPSRKRQKKTDSRVAELEKKIDALTASLAARGGPDTDQALDPAIGQHSHASHRPPSYTDQWQPPAPPPPPPPPPPPQQQQQQQQQPQQQPDHNVNSQSPTTPNQTAGVKRKNPDSLEYFGGELPKLAPVKYKSPPPVPQFQSAYSEPKHRPESDDMPYVDVIDRNLIDAKTAYVCFDRYNSEMCQQLPVVVFSTDQTAEELRKNKPILFLAVLAVGSGTIRPDLQPKLINEATRMLADRIIYNGEKSMELVQTIQLMTIFYQPPDRYEELNFNQLIHIAAVMAMDIGMGKRSTKGPYAIWKGLMEKSKSIADPNTAETRRCWLGCYYMCTNSAMSLRRSLLIRWTPYMEESIHVLHTAKDALPSDKWLCHLVTAQHIGEKIGVEFSMDDPASVLSLSDPQTQHHLRVFEQSLAEWREKGAEMMGHPVMQHTEAIINLYMHEVAMHRNHNIDDFRPPFNTTPIEGPQEPETITPLHNQSLKACLHSAHNAFEAFLAMNINELRALPTHFFVRNSYAAVALIKLYSAVAAKGSKFGSIFKTEELKVDSYLDRLIQTLQKVAEGGMSKVAYKFTLIFTMLRNWHLKRTETPPNGLNGRDHGFGHDHRGGSLPQPRDTSQAWSQSTNGVERDNRPPQPRSGLQMLSEAAMGPGRPIPPQTPQGLWIAPQTQVGQMQPIPGMPSMVAPGQDYNMMMAAYGVPTDSVAMGGFTSDDFMAFGLGDEWINFGFTQDNWSL